MAVKIVIEIGRQIRLADRYRPSADVEERTTCVIDRFRVFERFDVHARAIRKTLIAFDLNDPVANCPRYTS